MNNMNYRLSAWIIFLIAVSMAESSKLMDPMGSNFRVKAPNVILKFDNEISKFAQLFQKMTGGNLLSTIVKALPNDKINPVNNPNYSLTQTQDEPITNQYYIKSAAPLDGIATASPQKGRPLVQWYLVIVLAIVCIPFIILTIWGADDGVAFYGIVLTTGFCIAIVMLITFHQYMGDYLLVGISMFFGGCTLYSTYHTNQVRHVVFFNTFFACMLLSNLFHHAYAAIPWETINPAYCGIEGIIINTGLFGDNFLLMRSIYYISVISLAGNLYMQLPPSVRYEPKDSVDEELSKEYVAYFACVVGAWPTVSLASQILFLSGWTNLSPFDPLSFFYIPCQLRWNGTETYILLIFWAILVVIMKYLRRIVERQEREYGAQLITRRIKEHWISWIGKTE